MDIAPLSDREDAARSRARYLRAIMVAALIAGALGYGLGTRVLADSILRVQRYIETKTAPSIASNAFTVNLSTGTHFQVTLNANVTSITFSNPPPSGYAGSWSIALTQNGTGGFTVTGWPAAVKWASGVAPTVSPGANKTDIVSCLTYDGGTTDWCLYNQNF